MRLPLALALCLVLGSLAFAADPIPTSAPSEWSTIPFAASNGVTVTLRIRQSATWTQRDWLQIVIDNAGNDVPVGGDFDYARWNLLDGRIYEKSTNTYLRNYSIPTGNQVSWTALARSPAMDPWTLDPNVKPIMPKGKTVIYGKPSAQVAIGLGIPPADTTWHVLARVDFKIILRLRLELTANDGIFTPPGGVPIEFDWRAPTAEEIKAAIAEAHGLLKNPPDPRADDDFHLPILLANKQITAELSHEEVLNALKRLGEKTAHVTETQRQSQSRAALVAYVDDKWMESPLAVAFMTDALAQSDPNNLARDILKNRKAAWDDRLAEPVIEALEKARPISEAPPPPRISLRIAPNVATSPMDYLEILNKHPESWTRDATLTRRVGKSVQRLWLRYLDPEVRDRADLVKFRPAALTAYSLSHDPQVVADLRHLLDDTTVIKTTAGSSLSRLSPDIRLCDDVYSVICKILNVTDATTPGRALAFEGRNFDQSMTELRNTWDAAIADLKKKIDNP